MNEEHDIDIATEESDVKQETQVEEVITQMVDSVDVIEHSAIESDALEVSQVDIEQEDLMTRPRSPEAFDNEVIKQFVNGALVHWLQFIQLLDEYVLQIFQHRPVIVE